MTEAPINALRPKASVTVEAAAELVNVDAATIRRWSASGSVDLEWRGDMQVVRLDQVRAVAASATGVGRGAPPCASAWRARRCRPLSA